MLFLYGVADARALWVVLIVHTVHAMLVVLRGGWAWVRLMFTKDYSKAMSSPQP